MGEKPSERQFQVRTQSAGVICAVLFSPNRACYSLHPRATAPAEARGELRAAVRRQAAPRDRPAPSAGPPPPDSPKVAAGPASPGRYRPLLGSQGCERRPPAGKPHTAPSSPAPLPDR